ncbi:hypothetical protein SLEP1_g45453 [Rubroshorea leprosula]|uniref:HMA domain-containing protein n=1 Tax=Rubroshorea leprosula TaxID=152421 RepID=A0AAV5LLP0_9ROSI|nr:hypothetical protein SLEP1_g45453 [Rubroshorea leprosula]
MKQKIVIKVQMSCEKCRTKAKKIAAETDGVSSLAIEGEDRDQVVVTGDGIDSANLTRILRKKVGFATILSVQKVEENVDVGKEEKPDPPFPPNDYPYWQCLTPTFHQVVYDPTPSICSIM